MGRSETMLPPPLMPGDVIGIAAPSSPFDRETLYRGVAVLEGMGFRVFIPEDIFERDGYLAGSDHLRAGILNRLFGDKRIRAVICARGGFGAIRILPLLDIAMIRGNPKIFVGFSDATALLSVLYSQCGFAVFHGIMIERLADADPKTRESLFAALTSRRPVRITAENGVAIKGGTAKGIVVGGNLTTLCHLLGTPFMPDFGGRILFLEDTGEAPYRIDRMLTQMKLAGCFDEIAGLATGYFEDCGNPEDISKIVRDIFKDNEIPILMGFEAGHGQPDMTIPLGLAAIMDADEKTLSYE